MFMQETPSLQVTGSILFQPKVNLTLDISDLTVKSVGVVFSGKAELNVGAVYNAVSGRYMKIDK